MAPSLVLTPTADTPDSAKRPFTFTNTLPGLTPTPATQPYDASACPWTGMPIRATLPLPRRTRTVHSTHASRRRTAARTPRFRHTLANDVESMEEEEQDGLPCYASGSESDWDEPCVSAERCCMYQSITATEGLGAWSFEELRVECYGQSLIARGTRPLPVVQPSLAIPPAFVPRIVPRNEI